MRPWSCRLWWPNPNFNLRKQFSIHLSCESCVHDPTCVFMRVIMWPRHSRSRAPSLRLTSVKERFAPWRLPKPSDGVAQPQQHHLQSACC